MLDAVGGGELDVEVGCAGAAGVAAGEDLGAGGDVLADLDVGGVAVAVGPVVAVDVADGDADAAGSAAGGVGAAALVPPVVRPVLDGDDGAAADGVDGCAGRDEPVPSGVSGMRCVRVGGGEQVGGAGGGVAVGVRCDRCSGSARTGEWLVAGLVGVLGEPSGLVLAWCEHVAGRRVRDRVPFG